jgi:hypothetical protein
MRIYKIAIYRHKRMQKQAYSLSSCPLFSGLKKVAAKLSTHAKTIPQHIYTYRQHALTMAN